MPELPRFLDRVRAAVRTRHYSRRTEEAYLGWTKRFILFHRKRHPASMGADEVNAFLSHLAVEGERQCADAGAGVHWCFTLDVMERNPP